MIASPPSQRGQTLIFGAVTLCTLFFLLGLGLQVGLLYREQARLSRACEAAIRYLYLTASPRHEQAAIGARQIAEANCRSLSQLPDRPTSAQKVQTPDGLIWKYIFQREQGGHLEVQIKTDGEDKILISANVTGQSPNKPFFFPAPQQTGSKTDQSHWRTSSGNGQSLH
jgi:hypothetical protein